VGSNPTLSATFLSENRVLLGVTGRGAGVAELAALEMLCTGNRTVGSNPTLSAFDISWEKRRKPLLALFDN
jgi:hypothetical protein